MNDAILAAILQLAKTGLCSEADAYPDPQPNEVTGYTVVKRCALPTTEQWPENAIVARYQLEIAIKRKAAK